MLSLLPSLLLSLPALEETTEEAPGGPNFMVLMIALAAVFYFVMIRPEQKNRRQRTEMLGGMKKGDEVMTKSGMYATVVTVRDNVVTLQAADGVRLRFSVEAIQTVLNDEANADEKPTPEGNDDDKDDGLTP